MIRFYLNKLPALCRNGFKLVFVQKCFQFSDNSNFNKYRSKTSRQIDQEIGQLKYKSMQNTYKSISSKFGLKKPTPQQLQKAGQKYPKPKTIKYDLQTLRQCSRQYPVHLYYELKNKSSPFHEVIDKILNNLWKAQKKQTLEMLQFLLCWRYKGIDIMQMYISVIQRDYEIDCFDYFAVLRQFFKSENQSEINNQPIISNNYKVKLKTLVESIQIKILQKLRQNKITEQQYGPLIKIINLMNVNDLLSEQFYYAVSSAISSNINSISPKDALSSYVFFTYNQADIATPFKLQDIKMIKKEQEVMETLISQLLQVIEKRVLADECLNFYNSEQVVALMHTFLKNSILRGVDNNMSEQNPDRIYFNKSIDKIINRIQVMWVSQDIRPSDKKMILKLSNSLVFIKKQKVIALYQSRFLKQAQKFENQLLTELYLMSFQANMLTSQIQRKLQNRIVEQLFNLQKDDVSRTAWLLAVTNAENMEAYYKKIEDIVLGGLGNKDYKLKDVSVIVWGLSSTGVTDKMINKNKLTKQRYVTFWTTIQQYLFSQISKNVQKYSKTKKQGSQLINDCSWVLWAYLNNHQLSLKTLDLISMTIIELMTPSLNQTPNNIQFSAFQLTNITSFYHSINYPQQFEPVIKQVQIICYEQFIKIFRTMQCAQMCRVLKYIGHNIWKNIQISKQILELFNMQIDEMNYTDVLTVLGLLMDIDTKQKESLGDLLRKTVIKLNQRRLRFISIQQKPAQDDVTN